MPTAPPIRLSHFSVLIAELPTEVFVGIPVVRSMSHARPSLAERTVRSQPGTWLRHQVTRVSVEEKSFGGLAGNAAHSGLSVSWSTLSSRTSTCAVRASMYVVNEVSPP